MVGLCTARTCRSAVRVAQLEWRRHSLQQPQALHSGVSRRKSRASSSAWHLEAA